MLMFSIMFLLYKSGRMFFIMIALEFMMMSMMMTFYSLMNELSFLYFVCFGVISSLLVILTLVLMLKNSGTDKSILL